MILAQGGRFGGWAFYVQDGKPTYTHNWLGLESFTVQASEALAPGKAKLVMDFAPTRGATSWAPAVR